MGVDDNYEMDDEVAQQTAELLFDLLPYYDTGNEEAQIFWQPYKLKVCWCINHRMETPFWWLHARALNKTCGTDDWRGWRQCKLHGCVGFTSFYEVNDKSYSLHEQLIQAGAATDAEMQGLFVHYAASGGHASLVALLLMYGANAVAVDNMGYTAQVLMSQQRPTKFEHWRC